MTKVFGVFAALGLTATVSLAVGPYTGPTWTQQWDFSDGQQGWNFSGGGFWDNGFGGGSLHLGDGSRAQLLTAYALGGNTTGGHKPFILQADVIMWGTTTAGGSLAQDIGIQASRTGDGKGPALAGTNAGRQGVNLIDKAWDNTLYRKSFSLGGAGNDPPAAPLITTFQLDYGYSIPNKMIAWIKTPFVSYTSDGTGWTAVNNTAVGNDVHPTDAFPLLNLGAMNGGNVYGGGWGNVSFDNVKLLVPEPTSLGLLGLGSLLLMRRRRVA